MLLSQRIAKDPKYISIGPLNKAIDGQLLRVAIMNAQKFVVPNDFLDMTNPERIMDMNVTSLISLKDIKNGKEKGRDINALYYDYAMLPFPAIFIESMYSGILVVESAPRHYTVTAVTCQEFDGVIVTKRAFVFIGLMFITFEDGVVSFAFDESNFRKTEHLSREEIVSTYEGTTAAVLTAVLEILTFLNVKNVTIHKYKPTKKELKFVPPKMVQWYDYHVLDLYRDIVRYEKIEDIEQFINRPPEECARRRAHLVRGHFKRRKTGLFWWNAFARNLKNFEEVGFTDKVYNVKQ